MTSKVRVGIGLSPDLVRLERPRLLDLVARINASSIDHAVVTDHVSFRGGRGQDALTAMHYLAGLGIERELHTGVLILPLRHPTLVARQLLDLADIHEPGVVAGVGLGGDDPQEYTMAGMTTTERGERMDDALRLLVSLLAGGGPVDQDGYYPALGPGLERGSGRPVTVLVGGRVEAAYERAARADGWLGAFCSASHVARAAERVRGTSPNAAVGYQAWIGVGPDGRERADTQIRRFYGIDPIHFEQYVPVGGSDELIQHFGPYVEAGCNVLNLFPAGESELAIDEISRFAEAMHARARV